MPFQITADEVTVPRKVGEFRDAAGNLLSDQHDGKVYLRGEVLKDADVAPMLLRRYQAGDSHLRSLLVYVDDAGNEQEFSESAMNEAIEAQDMVEGAKQEQVGPTPSEVEAALIDYRASTPGASQPSEQLEQQMKTVEEKREILASVVIEPESEPIVVSSSGDDDEDEEKRSAASPKTEKKTEKK